MSLLKSRKELTVYYQLRGRGLIRRCGLCGGSVVGGSGGIKHTGSCLLRDPGVTHVRMSACSRRVVIRGPRRSDGKYWWTSGSSGKTYDIERCGRGSHIWWVMHERDSGKTIMDDMRLCDIRKRLQEHQGNL